jgi:hypothetical protein
VPTPCSVGGGAAVTTAVASRKPPVTAEHVSGAILVLRGHRVLLDEVLAQLYGVETRALVQAVKRNLARFPGAFMFQLTASEWAALRSQAVTLKAGRGQHRKYLPYASTEQGVAHWRAIAVPLHDNADVVHSAFPDFSLLARLVSRPGRVAD